MKRIRESVSMKDCWEISKFNSIMILTWLVVLIIAMIKLESTEILLSLFGMIISFNDIVSKYDDKEFSKLQDRIKELESK